MSSLLHLLPGMGKGKDTDFGVAKIAFETGLGVGQFTFNGYCDFAGFLVS
jgi:hypothetical protein